MSRRNHRSRDLAVPWTGISIMFMAVGTAFTSYGLTGPAQWTDFLFPAIGGSGLCYYGGGLYRAHRRKLLRARQDLVTLAAERTEDLARPWINRDKHLVFAVGRQNWACARTWIIWRMDEDSVAESGSTASHTLTPDAVFGYERFVLTAFSLSVWRFDGAAGTRLDSAGELVMASLSSGSRIRGWVRRQQMSRVGLGAVRVTVAEMRELAAQLADTDSWRPGN